MAYILAGTTLPKGPAAIQESNSTLVAQQRTLSGAVNRDFFGSNKRIWQLDYKNTNTTVYSTIKTIYTNYLSTGTAVSFSSTETNYAISSTTVHVDLLVRSFSIRGNSYISDFSLILTEA